MAVTLSNVPATLVGRTSASPTSTIRPLAISCSRNSRRSGGIVVALAPPAEAHRVLPDAARAEPGAGHERRSLVARHAHHGDVGVEPVEVGGDDRAEERRDADERGVPARLGGRRHRPAPLRRRRAAGARAPARPARRGADARAARGPRRPRGAPPPSPARAAGRHAAADPEHGARRLERGQPVPDLVDRAEVQDRRLEPRAGGAVAPRGRRPSSTIRRGRDVREPRDEPVTAHAEARRRRGARGPGGPGSRPASPSWRGTPGTRRSLRRSP